VFVELMLLISNIAWGKFLQACGGGRSERKLKGVWS